MFIFFIRTIVLAVTVSASSLSSASTLSAQSELLCSPEGLMRLLPQFNVNGKFTIPNPNNDLQTFLSAQQGLSNAIDMILAKENKRQNPSNVGGLPSRPLIFSSNWLSSEVGIQTDGATLSSPESEGKFRGHRLVEMQACSVVLVTPFSDRAPRAAGTPTPQACSDRGSPAMPTHPIPP